jgi:hypothetical protein
MLLSVTKSIWGWKEETNFLYGQELKGSILGTRQLHNRVLCM